MIYLVNVIIILGIQKHETAGQSGISFLWHKTAGQLLCERAMGGRHPLESTERCHRRHHHEEFEPGILITLNHVSFHACRVNIICFLWIRKTLSVHSIFSAHTSLLKGSIHCDRSIEGYDSL
jgi:hypothetical protein